MAPIPKKKPGHRNARPVLTHITVEEEAAREKRLHVVRDRDWQTVWGANLPWSQANELQQQIAGRMKSDNVRVEEMPTDPALLAFCATAEVVGTALPPDIAPPSPEAIAKQQANKAAADAQRAAAQANKAMIEAQQRAKAAIEHANKLAADAQKQADAVAKNAAAQAAAASGELFTTPDANGESDEAIDPALIAESEALADASLEDILGD